MRRYPLLSALLLAALTLAGVVYVTAHQPGGLLARDLAGACHQLLVQDGVTLADTIVSPSTCNARRPTATATSTPVPPTATATMVMPSPSPAPSGWHAPTTHEHGDGPPPAWVVNSGHAPFTQSRESHVGYKGVYATSPAGAESYLITHVLSTVAARSHGDHDYQLWLRAPSTGEVLYYAGVLDFGNPPPLRTADTGERPIILSVGDGGCETWYGSDLGRLIFDLGWTICDRYQSFDGTVLGGVGAFRSVDWIVPCDRLPAVTSLRQYCATEFGVSRLAFIVSSRDYTVPGLVPLN